MSLPVLRVANYTLLPVDAFYCIIFSILLIYLTHNFRIQIVQKMAGSIDNMDPRTQVQRLSDGKSNDALMLARATGAHANQQETIPLLIGAVLMAHIAHVPRGEIDWFATVYLFSRAMYIPVFIFGSSKNLASARTTLFFVSLGVCVYLMYLASATHYYNHPLADVEISETEL